MSFMCRLFRSSIMSGSSLRRVAQSPSISMSPSSSSSSSIGVRFFAIMSKYEKPVGANDAVVVPKRRPVLSRDAKARLRYSESDLQRITVADPSVLLPKYDHFQQPEHPKSLTVAIVGIPNAGKSSLVNALVGKEISIVTPKAQTTRSQVLGIATEGDNQIVFVDTPGVVSLRNQARRRKKIQREITVTAQEAVAEADMVCLVVDSARAWGSDAEEFITKLRALKAERTREIDRDIRDLKAELNIVDDDEDADDDLLGTASSEVDRVVDVGTSKLDASKAERIAWVKKMPKTFVADLGASVQNERPVIMPINRDTPLFVLIMNKCDLVDKERARRKAELIGRSGLFDRVFFVSALKPNTQFQALKDFIFVNTKPQQWSYAPDATSDLSDMEIVEDAIRQQIFLRMNEEVPYNTAQRNLGWTNLDDGSLRIDHYILCRNVRHKRALVGQNAKTIAWISLRAQNRISELLGRKVHLYLTVKVSPTLT